MQVKVLVFAHLQDQLGFHERLVECAAEDSPRQILEGISPGFDPQGLRAAVDLEYTDWDAPLGEARELAVIPPVSGG